jgi:hypothetical protein
MLGHFERGIKSSTRLAPTNHPYEVGTANRLLVRTISSGPTFKDYLLSSRPGKSRHLMQATFVAIFCFACAPRVAESGLDEAARLSFQVEEMYAR